MEKARINRLLISYANFIEYLQHSNLTREELDEVVEQLVSFNNKISATIELLKNEKTK